MPLKPAVDEALTMGGCEAVHTVIVSVVPKAIGTTQSVWTVGCSQISSPRGIYLRLERSAVAQFDAAWSLAHRCGLPLMKVSRSFSISSNASSASK
jgi:hypothetical protein